MDCLLALFVCSMCYVCSAVCVVVDCLLVYLFLLDLLACLYVCLDFCYVSFGNVLVCLLFVCLLACLCVCLVLLFLLCFGLLACLFVCLSCFMVVSLCFVW